MSTQNQRSRFEFREASVAVPAPKGSGGVLSSFLGLLGRKDGHSGSAAGLMHSSESLRSLVSTMSANVFVADRDLKLVFASQQALASLKTIEGEIEKAFGIRVEEMVGGSIHRFHKDPARIETLLRDAVSRPHESLLRFGKVTLKTRITAITSPLGIPEGYVAVWEDVTEQVRSEAETQRVCSMMENVPVNIFFADASLTIRYANPASLRTLQGLAQYLPVPVDKLTGSSIDIFHKNPATVRRIVEDPRNLPHRAKIQLGPEVLDLLISATRDNGGNYIGSMVTWEVATDKLRLEKEHRDATEREKARMAELDQKIGQLLEVVDAVAAGDLTRKVPVEGNDPAGRMGASLSKLIADLRSSISSIALTSEMLATAASQMAAVSQTMNANAEETAAQSGVVSAASEEVRHNVETMASGSEEMNASIREIAKNSHDAAKVSGTAVQAAGETGKIVAKLGDSSTQIGDVLKVITTIAEQTNLLALNATIEAARAGEAGKGFAVVANEVKELSKETARATEDIGKRIQVIRTDTQNATAAIGEITRVITQISDFTNSIASAVEEQTATTSEMSRNISDAARGTAEIVANITHVSEIAKNTSQGAHETQTAAANLKSISKELNDLVNRFKFRDTGTTFMTWNDAFSVNIAEIDNQHRRLIDLINTVYRGMMQNEGREAAGRTLDDLVEYTVSHFGYEERLFKQYGYPETASHVEKHQKLVAQVSEFYTKFKQGKAVVDNDLMRFLKEWLVSHIMGTDKKYSSFLNGKGVA